MAEPIEPVKEYPKNDLYRYIEDKIKPKEQTEFLNIVRRIRTQIGSMDQVVINDEDLAEAFEGTKFQMLIVDFRTEYELRTRSKSNRPPRKNHGRNYCTKPFIYPSKIAGSVN